MENPKTILISMENPFKPLDIYEGTNTKRKIEYDQKLRKLRLTLVQSKVLLTFSSYINKLSWMKLFAL